MQCVSNTSARCSNPCCNWEYTPRTKLTDPRTIASPSWQASIINQVSRTGMIWSGTVIPQSEQGDSLKARHAWGSLSQQTDFLMEAEKSE